MARTTVTAEVGRLRHFLRRRGRPLTGLEAFNLGELKRGADPMRWLSQHGVWPEDRSS